MLTFEKSMQCGRSEEHIFARSQSKRYSTHAALILGQLAPCYIAIVQRQILQYLLKLWQVRSEANELLVAQFIPVCIALQ